MQDGAAPQPYAADARYKNPDAARVAGSVGEAAVADLLRNMAALPGRLERLSAVAVGIGAAGVGDPATRVPPAKCPAGRRLPRPGHLHRRPANRPVRGPRRAGRHRAHRGHRPLCYGQSTDGREARSGGWGSLMDDEGGGFALGRDALAAVVRAEDGRIAPTVLHDAVFEALQVGAVRELIGKIYAPGFGKREVAALAPLVGAAAEQGDAAALRIAGKGQAASWPCWCARWPEKLGLQSARVACAGSVLQKCAPVRSAARTQLQTLLPQLALAEPRGRRRCQVPFFCWHVVRQKNKSA